jgi:hypothetical protein
MAFFAILFALLIEQVRPLAPRNPVYAGMLGWTRWVSRNFDAGRGHHGWIAWALTVLVPTGAAALLHIGLDFGLGWPLAMLWCSISPSAFASSATTSPPSVKHSTPATRTRPVPSWPSGSR